MKMARKLRINWCWECGRKLWGNKHAVRAIHGYEKILHKECAENLFPNHLWAEGTEEK